MDIPPTYEEATRMDGLCPAYVSPVQEPVVPCTLRSLDEALRPFPETVTLGLINPDISGTFCVRDKLNCVLLKGVINPGTVHMYNTNGEQFLTLRTSRACAYEYLPTGGLNYTRRSLVMHDEVLLGKVECYEFGLHQITAHNCHDAYDLFANYLGIDGGFIAICKSYNTPPMCQATIPHSVNGLVNFSATMYFPAESPSSKVDQCLCLAVVITFILSQTVPETFPENFEGGIEARHVQIVLGVLLFIVAIVVIVKIV